MADTSTYTLLQRVSVTSGVSSVTFSNIPQTGYTDLKIVASTRNLAANTLGLLGISFNGVTTNLSSRIMYGFGNNLGTSDYATFYAIWGYTDGATATASTFASTEFTVPNYTNASNKLVCVDSINENLATDGRQSMTAGLWSSTAAITSVTITSYDGGAATSSLVQGSTFSLYATSAVGTTPGTPKALGGDIVTTDGTYWYHSFLNSGAFIPQSALSCSTLVVAGGGGGGYSGNDRGAGGGGAGGYRTGSSVSLTALTSYPVIIGAGGAAGTSNPYQGFNGTGSTFSTTNTSGGGGGGSSAVAVAGGVAGGSGGGACNTGGSGTNTGGAGNTGSYSPVEGYAGGNAIQNGGGYNGGGGGGSSGAGPAASAYDSTGTTGGAGTANSISGTSVTYATGGRGAGATMTRAAVAGTASTGNGGEGVAQNYTAANGGSGIVIIRYPV